jgi:hypothetical protein
LLKRAIQQPCRKGHTVILHCNFKNAVTMSTFFNKGQRMPNIFERARAYDNWNENELLNQVINAADNGELYIIK